MALTPWYKVDGINPRADLREGRGLDMAEFAVNLEQVRTGRAPADYKEPDRFLERTYLTQALQDFAVQVLKRLSGDRVETNAVYNLATQFGGGKTHALSLLYHLARNGSTADHWIGVRKLLHAAGLASVPQANVAVFVGTEFDSIKGRGGDDGTPKRLTPWGEIAYQLGGEASFQIVAEHDREFTEPKGDAIRAMLPQGQPCLILMDEILSYVSTGRKRGWGDRLYNFLQALSETVRGEQNIVLVASIPGSEMEYTAADEADEQRFKKMLDRLGKAYTMSSGSETSEIIRRRLFEWENPVANGRGELILPGQADKTCRTYGQWVQDNYQSLPGWFPRDRPEQAFRATYPFHPAVLSVFERKWQAIPRFQRTRGVLRMLALWVSQAYQEGMRKAHRDPLIGLGTAPLDDQTFRAIILEQLGDDRIEGVVTTDLCGKRDSHATRLDAEAASIIKKARLHRKVATAILFESNGGCTRAEATLPELRLAVGEPELDLANIESVLDTMSSDLYYLLLEKNKYRFSLTPNLNKILADRRAGVDGDRIEQTARRTIQQVFTTDPGGVQVIPFPNKSSDIPNRPSLSLVAIAPDQTMQERSRTLALIESYIRECGASNRTFKSAPIFAVAESDTQIRDEVRNLLALEDIRDQESELLDENQRKQLNTKLKLASSNLRELVWRSYRHAVLLGKDNQLRAVDFGQINSSQASSLTRLFVNRLQQDGDIERYISPNYLIRNWPPAFTEWPTRNVRDAFFASPQFPRLLNPETIRETIARGVSDGVLAYVGKAEGDRYEPFKFETSLSLQEVEIGEAVFIITADTARTYRQRITEPPRLAQLELSPIQVELQAGQQQAYTARGLDQYGEAIALPDLTWSTTGGTIDDRGVLTAGENSGNFTVTVEAAGVQATVRFTIPAKSTRDEDEDYDPGKSDPPPPQPPQGLEWRGSIPPQKWMNFYTQVLSKLVANRELDVDINIGFSAQGDLSPQKLDEIRAALQDLGLDDDVELR